MVSNIPLNRVKMPAIMNLPTAKKYPASILMISASVVKKFGFKFKCENSFAWIWFSLLLSP